MKTLALVLLLALPLHGQLTESIEVNVLELEVAVLDRAGNPVEGLTRADFDVQIGGRRTNVTNFYAIRRGEVVDEQTAAAPSAPRPAQTSIPTSLVILIDDTRLGPFARKRAFDALREYVKENVGANTSAMLARWNGTLSIRTRPTERPGLLLAELDAIATEHLPPRLSERRDLIRSLDESLNGVHQERDMELRVQQLWRNFNAYAEREVADVERTLKAIREVIDLTATFDGRKVLLYVSEGLPVSPGVELFDYWDRASRALATGADAGVQELARRAYNGLESARYDRSGAYRRLATAAQAANVSFFAVDAGGVRGFESGGVQDFQTIAQMSTMLVRSNEQDGLRELANETGGRFIANENNLAGALAVMSDQFTTYYSLGVRAPSSTRLTKVRVAVKNRPDLRVVTARQRKPLTRAEEMQRAVRSRLYTRRGDNPLGADVVLGSRSSSGGRCVVPLRIIVPREKVTSVGDATAGVAMHFALLDDRMQESDVRTTLIPLGAGSIEHSMSLGLKPGQYVLSMAIADQIGGETSYLQREIECR